jgi:hypothetical protein
VADQNWASIHKDATTNLEGDFPVIIVSTEAKKTKDGTKDKIDFKAKIESGTYVGRLLYGQFTISLDSPTAMRILFSHWAALGLDGDFFKVNPSATVHQLAQALVGRRGTAVVAIREWQGQKREGIEGWKISVGGSGPKLGALGAGLGSGPVGNGSAAGPGGPTSSPAGGPGSPTANVVPAAVAAEIGAQLVAAASPVTTSTPPPEAAF